MKHGSFFNGIGGFQLAAAWVGWENIFSCEINNWCNRITKQHFPNCKQYGDIIKTDFTNYAKAIDIISGGFPCQPYSVAGNRKGKEDNRHLWPEMFRAIRQIQPYWIVGENVPGIVNWSGGMVVNEIKTNLEDEGFTFLPPIIIPACAVNADHRRDRVWFIAHSHSNRESIKSFNEREGFRELVTAYPDGIGCKGRIQRVKKAQEFGYDTKDCNERPLRYHKFGNDIPPSRICRAIDGIPNRMDRIKGLGNAIVPQVAYEIFKTIEQYELLTS